MATANDSAWAKFVAAKGLALDGEIHLVQAHELKSVTGREPRLLAKFDTPAQLPEILSAREYSLLPVTNGAYALFPGNIFAPLQGCPSHKQFADNLQFPLLTAGRGSSEFQYLDNAFNLGILSDFTGEQPLFLTIRGRERSGAFEFRISSVSLKVDGVQIEVDAGYESRKHIILVEAKIGADGYFNLRQLYYPFRHFSNLFPSKQVRTLFFQYDLRAGTYTFFEFEFARPEVMDSIRQLQCQVYAIADKPSFVADELSDPAFETNSPLVPQADDLNKVLELLQQVNQGQTGKDEVADYFVFDKRQSSYYAEAAEYLGLLNRRAGVYELTPRGREFVNTPASRQREYIAKAVVNSWVFREIVRIAREQGAFGAREVEQVIKSVKKSDGSPRYTGQTITRRRQTILAWVNWLTSLDCFRQEGARYVLPTR